MHNVKELFERIANDDEAAFRELFQHYFHRLYTVLLEYTNRRTDAEDIVQSVFLKIWEKRQSLASVNDPENWLFINARNAFLDRFRKLRSEQHYYHYLTEVFTEETDAPDHLLILKQKERLVRNAIALLPEKQQQAFLLSRQEGLTYEEIAERMGIARTTVKEHITRAMKTVREYLLANRNELLSIPGLCWLIYYFFKIMSS